MSRPGNEPPLFYVGTSGWSYAEWRGRFYPQGLKPADYLAYYATHFNSVEINSSFYRMPDGEVLTRWKHTVPDDFIFSVKAGRFMTHRSRFSDSCLGYLKDFLAVLSALRPQLGAVLFQLPPQWGRDTERLSLFLSRLPQDYRYVFEFRNPTWFCEEIYALLRKYKAAFCLYHFEGREAPAVITADFIYARFHGSNGKYMGQYDRAFLTKWAQFFINSGLPGYCYFDNTADGSALKNATEFEELCAHFAIAGR